MSRWRRWERNLAWLRRRAERIAPGAIAVFIAGGLIGSLVGCNVRDEKPSTPTASERAASPRRLTSDTPDSRSATQRLADLRIVSPAVGRAADIQNAALDRATTRDLERAIADLSFVESLYIREFCDWDTFERSYRGGELLSYFASAAEWLTHVPPPDSLFRAHDALMATMLNASTDPEFFVSAVDALRNELRLAFLYCMPEPSGWPTPQLQSPTRSQSAAPLTPTPRQTPVAARTNIPTRAPTPVTARANTPTPAPTPAVSRTETATLAPTAAATSAGTATPAPTPTPTATGANTPTPMPAPTAAGTETPAPTPTAAAPEAFGDGTYLVPSEIAPGPYRAADTGSRCRVYRDNVHLVTSGPGRVTFEVQAEWSSIRVSECGTFEVHTPRRLASFGDGTYLVPSELAPETYRAADTGSRCRVYRDNVHLVTSGPGRVTFEVQAEWSSIRVRDCGTFEVHTPSRLTSFGDGVYVVPSELAPGTYRATDTAADADVYRDNVHLVTSGPGRVTFEVQAAWSSIRVSECGTFEVHTPSRLASFGDGVYLVPSEVAPETYRAADTGSRCRVYRDNVHLVTSGPGRVTFEVQAEWSSIRVSECGTFELHTPSRLASFGDGVYLVPSEVAPGTYSAADTGSRCDVYRDNVHLVTSGPGRVTFEVQAAWSSIRSERMRHLRTPHSEPPRLLRRRRLPRAFRGRAGNLSRRRHGQPMRCLPRQRPPRDFRPRAGHL